MSDQPDPSSPIVSEEGLGRMQTDEAAFVADEHVSGGGWREIPVRDHCGEGYRIRVARPVPSPARRALQLCAGALKGGHDSLKMMLSAVRPHGDKSSRRAAERASRPEDNR
jgi:hypothetical protein